MHVMTDKMYCRSTSYTTSCITYMGIVNSGYHVIFIIVTTVIGDTCNLWHFVFFVISPEQFESARIGP